METRQYRQIHLAQNFLKSPRLVQRLVALSSIGSDDTVCEIGPGRGIITAELARTAGKVIAIEKDARLVRRLRERFRAHENVEIVEKDVLTFCAPRSDYKIFASIPYNATAAIVRQILYERPSPSEAYLIMQKEPARKFSGVPRETLFSVMAKPFVEFEILAYLRRTDFDPMPSVDSVLLAILRRPVPLIRSDETFRYREFIRRGFCSWKLNLRAAFKHVFTYKQWKRIARDLCFPLNARPTDLSFEQWLGLYRRSLELRLQA
jgi:23S rRNA (adenine-N6)-dimethyltransferase